MTLLRGTLERLVNHIWYRGGVLSWVPAAPELARPVGGGTSTQTGARQGGHPARGERYCRGRTDRWRHGQDAGADCAGQVAHGAGLSRGCGQSRLQGAAGGRAPLGG